MRARRLMGLAGLFALSGAMVIGVAAPPAGAAVFGPINDVATLRDVIENDATNAGGDTVVLGAGLTFTLTCADGGALDHNPATPLTIQGNGSIIELEQPCDDAVLLHENPSDVSDVLRLEDLTIRGGNITSGGDGGGVDSDTDTELAGVLLTDNHVAPGSSGGGGLTTDQDLSITDSTVTGNSSSGPGAGMTVGGNVTALRSTFAGNDGNTSGGTLGGGAFVAFGTAHSLVDSTVSGNTSNGPGGGIAWFGSLTVTNSTITGNTATTFGGGTQAGAEIDSLVLIYSTVVGNTAAAGANLATSLLESFGSVVAQPLGGGENCTNFDDTGATTTTSNGYNFDDDGSCGFGAGPGDQSAFAGALLLGGLADNGGPTPTLLPATDSPLVDAIPSGACEDDGAAGITTDQRGEPRPALTGCDVGSVEVQPAPPPPTPVVPTPVPLVPAPIPARPTFTG